MGTVSSNTKKIYTLVVSFITIVLPFFRFRLVSLGKGTETQNIMFLYDDQTMSHLKMSTISFYLPLKVSRFSNTYYNDNYLRQFTELQINILQDKKKKQPYIKIPTQHYTAGRSLHQTMPIFLSLFIYY